MTDTPEDRPDAAELIAIARTVLVEQIQPVLPPGQRLAGLMIANALGIAERALRLPSSGILDAAPLIHAIRSGRHDGDASLHGTLVADARQRVAIANPRYLDR